MSRPKRLYEHATPITQLAKNIADTNARAQGDKKHAPDLLALSVRQPWAWAIIHAGKDIENRSWMPNNPGLRRKGKIAIHASKGITEEDYEEAKAFMAEFGVICPPAIELQRGGIIGTVYVDRAVTKSESPWFMGPRGLVLSRAAPFEFTPAKGKLGFFKWQEDKSVTVETPEWMKK